MTTSTATNKPLANGGGILELIPQRPPIVMVDTLWRWDESSAETGLTVKEDNIFVEDGRLRESGVIEHVAQSAATFNGYGFRLRGIEPTLGYIAEIKRFRVESLPPVGSRLRTEIVILGDAGGVLLVSATVRCCGVGGVGAADGQDGAAEAGREFNGVVAEFDGADEVIATGQMKLFITEES